MRVRKEVGVEVCATGAGVGVGVGGGVALVGVEINWLTVCGLNFAITVSYWASVNNATVTLSLTTLNRCVVCWNLFGSFN